MLVNFYLTSHLLFSYHVIMAANVENFLISADFSINFRKNRQISNNYRKISESYGQKTLGGSLKTPPA